MYPDANLNLNYETADAVYFFTAAYEPLNNWSAHRLEIWEKTFPTLEHAFHYKKFADTKPEVAEAILKAPSPWAAMRLERQNKSYRRADWQDIKLSVMEELARAKIAQHEDVRERLLASGAKTIYENSPWDDFWGYADGKGQNQLGKIFMKIREEINNG